MFTICDVTICNVFRNHIRGEPKPYFSPNRTSFTDFFPLSAVSIVQFGLPGREGPEGGHDSMLGPQTCPGLKI